MFLESVEDIVRAYKARILDDNIFFDRDIPAKKLKNALISYAHDVIERDVLVLIDNTVFGSAKDGALITASSIYVHNMFEAPRSLKFSQITKVTFVEGLMESLLRIDDNDLLKINVPKKKSMNTLAEMLNKIVELSISRKCANLTAEKLLDLKTLYDNGVLSIEEYQKKRSEYLAKL